MTNTKSTKRALVSSVLVILMCVAMLIGTTFAWFTDTASTAVNKIQAGNLDVALEMKDNNGNWVTAEGKTLQFKVNGQIPAEGTQILWEPGCRYELPALRVVNKDNLALKYKIQITGIQGDAKLNEAIEWNINDANLGADHSLAAGASHTLTISGHMKEAAGNEYQGLSIDGIGITVIATQDTVENDSFDNQYDKDATYPVTNDTELKDAISSGKPGTSVAVAPGTYALPATVAAGVSIVGSGANNTTLQAPATTSSLGTTGLVISNEGVKISDVTLTAPKGITSNQYCGVVDINNGGTALENVVINNNAGYASSVVVNAGVKKGETVTLSNVTLNGGFKPIHIVDSANGTVVLDNCEITGTYTLNVNSNSSQDLVLKVNNSKLHGWTSYSKIHSATFVNTEFSKGGSAYDYMRPYADTTLTKCTFDADFLMGAGATGITITIDKCTFGGTSVTAENIKAMLDEDDMANLKNCTIIVNGVTVTL